MSLTPAQQAAITRLGQDVCVMAGPGSGKTRVLVERYRWLLESQGLRPARLLALTFTDKAAAELRHRLLDAFAGQPGLREEVHDAPILTIDALCIRLLRENALDLGVDPDFQVLDEIAARLLLAESIDTVLNGLLTAEPDRLRALFESWDTGNPGAALERTYEDYRLSGDTAIRCDPAAAHAARTLVEQALLRVKPTPAQAPLIDDARAWLRRTGTGLVEGPIADVRGKRGVLKDAIVEAERLIALPAFDAPRETLAHILRQLDATYRAAKRRRAAFDFHDLEAETLALLTGSPATTATVRDRYDFVLMDEVQDTNPLQWKLASLLRRPGRFFAVGDINQAIYGFRHARPESFREYRDAVKAGGGQEDRLRENFRSHAAILDLAERTLGNAEGLEPPKLMAARQFASTPEPAVACLEIKEPDQEPRGRTEAAWVADQIAHLLNSGFRVDLRGHDRRLRCADIAILCRTTGRFRELESALAARGIPYLMTGGTSFFSEQEVLDALLWLRALAHPYDEVSLAGVLRSPFVGIDPGTLWALRTSASSLIEAISASRIPLLAGCAALWACQRQRADDVSPDQLLTEAFDWASVWSRWSPAQTTNVAKLLRLLRDRWAAAPGGLASTLEYFDHLQSHSREANAPSIQSPDAVQLMTIHAAKGLEFPVVFLPALDQAPQSDSHDLVYLSGNGLGAKWRGRAGEPLYDDAAQDLREQHTVRNKQEANRLLYVAMTRAEQKLVLSFPQAARANPWTRLIREALPPTAVQPPWPVPPSLEPAPAPPIELLPPPALAPALALPVAVTDVQRFLDCPRRYFLDVVVGWPVAPANAATNRSDGASNEGDELDPSAIGTAVHSRLAGNPGPADSPEVEQLTRAFHESPLGRQAAMATAARHEEQFLVRLAGLTVRGQIDLSFEEGGRLVLVDYKTDQVTGPEVAARARHYSLQVQLYALALQELRGRLPDEACLHFLRPGLVVEADLSARALREARSALERLADHLQRRDFPLRESERCHRCPHRMDVCPGRGAPEQLGLF